MGESANVLVQHAKQKLKCGGFLSFITGGPRYDEALDLYKQAANQYKISKDWQNAGDCFLQCAHCARESGSASDDATYTIEAGKVYQKISTVQAVEQYQKAIVVLNADGRFHQSGKLLLTVAELYEGEHLPCEQTKEYYRRAAEMFALGDNGKSNFTKCNLKYAEYAARDGQIQEAINIFESEGQKALQNKLLQYAATDLFLRAGILYLAQGDSVTVNFAVEKYVALDPRFEGSREGKLLANLAEALEGKDTEKFVESLRDYDNGSCSLGDRWKVEFLLKAKDVMVQDDGFADDIDLR